LSDSLSELIAAASEPLASGEPRPLSIEGGERFAETLEALLRRKNGFYAFESALHVLPSGTGEDVMSLERWNAPDLWRHEYGDMTEGCFFFGEDVFGGQFCFRAGQVCTFDPETGDIEPLAPSLDAWAGEILRRYDNLTGHPLAHDRVEDRVRHRRVLAWGQAHERLEVADELRLVVILAIERADPLERGVEHELGEAAQETLAAQQQLRREPEVAPGQPLERVDRQVRDFRELGHRRDSRIEHG